MEDRKLTEIEKTEFAKKVAQEKITKAKQARQAALDKISKMQNSFLNNQPQQPTLGDELESIILTFIQKLPFSQYFQTYDFPEAHRRHFLESAMGPIIQLVEKGLGAAVIFAERIVAFHNNKQNSYVELFNEQISKLQTEQFTTSYNYNGDEIKITLANLANVYTKNYSLFAIHSIKNSRDIIDDERRDELKNEIIKFVTAIVKEIINLLEEVALKKNIDLAELKKAFLEEEKTLSPDKRWTIEFMRRRQMQQDDAEIAKQYAFETFSSIEDEIALSLEPFDAKQIDFGQEAIDVEQLDAWLRRGIHYVTDPLYQKIVFNHPRFQRTSFMRPLFLPEELTDQLTRYEKAKEKGYVAEKLSQVEPDITHRDLADIKSRTDSEFVFLMRLPMNILSRIEFEDFTRFSGLSNDQLRMFADFLDAGDPDFKFRLTKRCRSSQELFSLMRFPMNILLLIERSDFMRLRFSHLSNEELTKLSKFLDAGDPDFKFSLTKRCKSKDELLSLTNLPSNLLALARQGVMLHFLPSLSSSSIQHLSKLKITDSLSRTLKALSEFTGESKNEIVDFVLSNPYFFDSFVKNQSCNDELSYFLNGEYSLDHLKLIFSVSGVKCNDKKYYFYMQLQMPEHALPFIHTILLNEKTHVKADRMRLLSNPSLKNAHDKKFIDLKYISSSTDEELRIIIKYWEQAQSRGIKSAWDPSFAEFALQKSSPLLPRSRNNVWNEKNATTIVAIPPSKQPPQGRSPTLGYHKYEE